MSEEQTTALSLRAAYAFGAIHGLEKEMAEIRDMTIESEWDSRYTSTLRRGYVVELFERRHIFDTFKAEHWAHGNTSAGEAKRRRYLRIKQLYEDFLAGRVPETDEPDEEQEFAAESDLRDFLAKHPACIEPGLSLYEGNNQRGVEFPIDGGRIDILAMDRSNKFVVIELKVGRGRNKTIGQLLYYMGWVDKNLGNGPCRGIIVAKDTPEDLVLAASRVPGVALYRYNLSVSVERAAPGNQGR